MNSDSDFTAVMCSIDSGALMVLTSRNVLGSCIG